MPKGDWADEVARESETQWEKALEDILTGKRERGTAHTVFANALRDAEARGRAAEREDIASLIEKRVRCWSNYDMCREAEIIAKLIRARASSGEDRT